MAKNPDVVPSNSGVPGGVMDSLKGVITICCIAGLGLYVSYNAGSSVSNKVLKQVNKERRKHERDKRRDLKERKKEEKRIHRLETIKALRGGEK